MSCHICSCLKPPPDCWMCSDYSYSRQLVPNLQITSAPPRREYRGRTRINEYKTVDSYTDEGVLYPDVLITTKLPKTWFGRLFMTKDKRLLEKSLTKNRMMCTEWPRK